MRCYKINRLQKMAQEVKERYGRQTEMSNPLVSTHMSDISSAEMNVY